MQGAKARRVCVYTRGFLQRRSSFSQQGRGSCSSVVEHSLGKGEATRSIRVKSTKNLEESTNLLSSSLSQVKIGGGATRFLG